MFDIFHYVGTDLSVSPSGDLLSVTDSERRKQKILRRLITNPGELVFHLNMVLVLIKGGITSMLRSGLHRFWGK
jgi:hypothetical protein